jgi:hypothetical protein
MSLRRTIHEPLLAGERIGEYKHDFGYVLNETLPIQKGIDEAAHWGHNTVWLPPGGWSVKADLVVPDGMRVVGCGYNTVLHFAAGTQMVAGSNCGVEALRGLVADSTGKTTIPFKVVGDLSRLAGLWIESAGRGIVVNGSYNIVEGCRLTFLDFPGLSMGSGSKNRVCNNITGGLAGIHISCVATEGLVYGNICGPVSAAAIIRYEATNVVGLNQATEVVIP